MEKITRRKKGVLGGDRGKSAGQAPPLWIAIVDDEPTLREVLVELLTEKGFRVTAFASGQEALNALPQKSFDAILCDMRMPEMSGEAFYRQVLARWPEQAARILFCTGDVLSPETQGVFTRTGNLFLHKPFRIEELEALLATLMERVRLAKAA